MITPTSKPFRTTIIVGILCGLLYVPLVILLGPLLGTAMSFKFILTTYLAGYALLLARWSNTGVIKIIFPLVLLTIMALLDRSYYHNLSFMACGLLILSWIRGSVCFPQPLLKTALVEIMLCAGGAALIAAFAPHTNLSFALAIWLFFLIQSLYFPLVTGTGEKVGRKKSRDRFEEAGRLADEILNGEV